MVLPSSAVNRSASLPSTPMNGMVTPRMMFS